MRVARPANCKARPEEDPSRRIRAWVFRGGTGRWNPCRTCNKSWPNQKSRRRHELRAHGGGL